MNIFYLHNNPIKSAKMHCDKHVVKMVIEYAQLLSTAHRMLDGTQYTDASSGRRIQRWKLDNSNMDGVLYKERLTLITPVQYGFVRMQFNINTCMTCS